MKKKKYIVIGGEIYLNSTRKGKYYISPQNICIAHKLNPMKVECMAENRDDLKLRGIKLEDYKVLIPREDGIYEDLSEE